MPFVVKRKLSRQVFVAYPYALYDPRDYRKVFTSLAKAFDVQFVFADEKITNMHILDKIRGYIRESDFSVFDISAWNPNVTLELGMALSLSDDWYILFNPEQTDVHEVPSDIRGIDRIQYTSFSGLGDGLSALLDQWYPKGERLTVDDYFARSQAEVLGLLERSPGLKVNEIADVLGIHLKMAQVVVGQLLADGRLRSAGKTRGVRYFLSPHS